MSRNTQHRESLDKRPSPLLLLRQVTRRRMLSVAVGVMYLVDLPTTYYTPRVVLVHF